MQDFDSLLGEPTPPTVETDAGASDFEKLREKVFGSRGKPSKRKSAKKEAEETTAKQLDEIFASENWEGVASLYFDARFAVTGWEGFLLEPSQKKTLGVSLATCSKMLLKIDPAYVALIVFLANFGGIIATKEMMFSQMKKEHEKRERKVS